MNPAEGNVEYTQEEVDDILIIKVNGRLDAITSPEMEKAVFDFISSGKHKLVLDFSGVDYLSSAGMRMLLSTTKKLKTLGGRLVVCNVAANVMDVLKMSGFDHVIDISVDAEDAVKSF